MRKRLHDVLIEALGRTSKTPENKSCLRNSMLRRDCLAESRIIRSEYALLLYKA